MEFISKNKKLLFFVFLIAFLLLSVIFLWSFSKPIRRQENLGDTVGVIIKGNYLQAEVADSGDEHYLGLSFRKSLAADHGMLFIFPNHAKMQFVMRNMNFPIDIIFIRDGIVKEIKADCQPEGSDYKKIYESFDEVDMVLEVPTGYAANKNIVPGDALEIISK